MSLDNLLKNPSSYFGSGNPSLTFGGNGGSPTVTQPQAPKLPSFLGSLMEGFKAPDIGATRNGATSFMPAEVAGGLGNNGAISDRSGGALGGKLFLLG